MKLLQSMFIGVITNSDELTPAIGINEDSVEVKILGHALIAFKSELSL